MALIKLSSLAITNISGKAGGTVYAHNKGGTYARDFAVPSNPKSQAQQTVRAQFGLFAGQWRGLTQAQRDAWIQAAPNFPVLDPFGDVKTLSGISLYVQLNNNLTLAGATTLAFPPSPAGAQGISVMAMTGTQDPGQDGFIGSGAIVVAAEDLTNLTILLYATPPVSPGVRNANNRLRLIQTNPATEGGIGIDWSNNYVDTFGQPPVGANIRLRGDVINTLTGERSASFFTGLIVTESV